MLQPYQIVRDLRTNVVDDDLDEFMASSLAARVGDGKDKEAAQAAEAFPLD